MSLPFDLPDETERLLALIRSSSDPSVRAAGLGHLLSLLHMSSLDQGIPVQVMIDQLLEAWEQWEKRDDP